jgi:hypothetical protein
MSILAEWRSRRPSRQRHSQPEAIPDATVYTGEGRRCFPGGPVESDTLNAYIVAVLRKPLPYE